MRSAGHAPIAARRSAIQLHADCAQTHRPAAQLRLKFKLLSTQHRDAIRLRTMAQAERTER
ncbi:hypothetical protein XhhCFBP4925_17000 [Xanthomonas hortorum pv. hederae]|nr:hypothetical protein XhhCFBP4925_17000 [Xanthomonas hortorum pv. hederae]PUE98661.1 hypothetical protein C7T87_18270 [Xanthomonas hortorum pv. hederae]